MLTCQILIRNDIHKIRRILDSLATFNAEILVADIGSEDGTADFCRGWGLEVFNAKEVRDFGALRNQLLSAGRFSWHMMLEPWEIVTDPTNVKKAISGQPGAYFFPILRDNLISYEVRLWHKSLDISFINPVYEYLDIDDKKASILSGMLYSDGERHPPFDMIQEWERQNPANLEPTYYMAFHYLSYKEWDKFLGYAYKYLFSEHVARKSTLAMKYYVAVVLCHIKKDANQSLKHTLECLAVCPLMAEYWCLLGDIYYYRIGDYKKAERFYQNAIILGSFRKEHDKQPIEIIKYREYPEKMISSCQKLRRDKHTIVKLPGIHAD